ncbi:MAG: M20/M25/M40 family metallo-hydrolase [Clostridia bacterium]|nr:M20/M25/M40 family metallo-hydrolase [Clostridia bacterium]
MNKRVVNEFLQLVVLDNPSKDERKVADYILARLKELGYGAYEDQAYLVTGGNTGNIICKIEGNPDKDKVMFLSHMDSVMPCNGKVPVINDIYIESSKNTILGSDDLSGVASMLELAAALANKEVTGGDVYLIFTISEEIGLLGAKNLDLSKINADYAYVLDSGGDIGTASISAPSHISFTVKIRGKAAHAGMEPEKGINAMVVASKAIAKMQIGRIDEETTCNLGVIKGGNAKNIVCEEIIIDGECRSRNEEKLNLVYNDIMTVFQDTVNENHCTIDISSTKEYSSFLISDEDEALIKFEKACQLMNLPFKKEHGGGGSDTNIIYSKGIKALNISTGMDKVHSVEERIKIDDLFKISELIKIIVSL